jgi:hypothetical protein
MPYRIIKKVKLKERSPTHAMNFGIDLDDEKTWRLYPLHRRNPRISGKVSQLLDANGNEMFNVDEDFEFEIDCHAYYGLKNEIIETRFLYLPLDFVRGYGVDQGMFVDLLLREVIVEEYGQTVKIPLYPKISVTGPIDIKPKNDEKIETHGSEIALKEKAEITDSKDKDQLPTIEVPQKMMDNHIWDLFICHASEDKEELVRPLARALVEAGYSVWYDEFELKLGDSLRRSIDKGLAGSRYGLVILSPNFFAKNWPQTELDGLAAKERDGEKVILPVWHNVDELYVREKSPTLADRYAAKTSKGIRSLVFEVQKVLSPSEKGHVEYIDEVQAYLFFPEGTPTENKTLEYHARNLRYRLIVNFKTKPPTAYYLTPNSEGWHLIEKYPHKWISQIIPSHELDDSFTSKWCAEKGFKLNPWVAEKKHLLET